MMADDAGFLSRLAAAPHSIAPAAPCSDQPSYPENSSLKLFSHVQDFRPVGTLGRGNMGTVLLAVAKHSGTPFALKITRKHESKTQRWSQRTEMEREILSTLHHPFLQTLHAHFESDKHSLLVMDFCSGGDLNVLRQRQPEKRFSEIATKFYAAEVLAALEHLHKLGIVYRDLKPENILVQGNGHIKLTDFDLSLKRESGPPPKGRPAPNCVQQGTPSQVMVQGGANKHRRCSLACLRGCLITTEAREDRPHDRSVQGGDGESESVCFVGTDEYVAPEVLRGGEHSFAMDWWGFGIFLYEMIYGRTPFKGRSRKETLCNIIEKEPEFPGLTCANLAKHLIRQLLVKEPSRRLGFSRGAEDIKCHPFFGHGLRWECLPLVCRAPFIPPPFCLSEFEEKAKKRKQLQTKLAHDHIHALKASLDDAVDVSIAEESSHTQSSSWALSSCSADSPDQEIRWDENLEEILASSAEWSCSETDAQPACTSFSISSQVCNGSSNP